MYRKDIGILKTISVVKSIGLICSLTSNSIILFLLLFRQRTNFGMYRYLMISYTVIEMIYSFSLSFSDMAAHSTDSTYVLFRPIDDFDRTTAQMVLLHCCMMYTALITTLVVHFIYRYVALCATNYTTVLFSSYKLSLWILSCIFSGVFILIWKYFLLGETEYSNNLLAPHFLSNYNLSIDSVVYNGPVYRVCENETCYTPTSAIIGMSVIMVMLVSCFIIMSYFGFKCYTKLQIPRNMSNATKSLQKQLFNALLIQSINPIVFMYIPISMLFLSPIFGIGFGSYANISVVCLSIYPPLDQFAILYIIRDFRIAVKDFFMRRTQNGNSLSVIKLNRVGSSTKF